MTLANGIAFGSFVLGTINFLFLLLVHLRSARKEIVDEVMALQQKVVVLEEKMAIFWRGVSYNAMQILHSPHTPEFDYLLERWQDNTWTQEEQAELVKKLQILLADPHESPIRKSAARMALLLIHLERATPEERSSVHFRDLFRAEYIATHPETSDTFAPPKVLGQGGQP